MYVIAPNLQNPEKRRRTELLRLRPPNNSEELCLAAVPVFARFNEGACASPSPICKTPAIVARQSSSDEGVPQTLLRSTVLRQLSGISKQWNAYVDCPKLQNLGNFSRTNLLRPGHSQANFEELCPLGIRGYFQFNARVRHRRQIRNHAEDSTDKALQATLSPRNSNLHP